MTVRERRSALVELAIRAHRARAEAVATCADLELALTRARALEPALQSCLPRSERPSDAESEARVVHLQDTVDGLMKRLESQGPIEQAKGIIMAQTHCDPDHAFEILRRASQRSNTKLRFLAVDLVARTSGSETAQRQGA